VSKLIFAVAKLLLLSFVHQFIDLLICSLMQMAFLFTSSVGSTESLWDFNIIGHCISVSFLLVAHVQQPDVHFEKSHINMGHIVLG